MKKHLVRNAVVCLALTGGVVAGTAGIASAEGDGTATGSTGRPSQEQVCDRAQDVWQRLIKIDERLHEHYRKLVALRDKAAAEGKTELAERLTQRLERTKAHHERVEARLKQLHDKAASWCTLPDVPAPNPLTAA